MAWVEQQPNGLWAARWREAAGRKQSDDERFTTRIAAERYANRQEVLAREQGAAAPIGAMTWSAWKPTWLAGRQLAARTVKTEESSVRLHIEPYWGPWALADIGSDDVQDWVNTMVARGMSAAMVHRVYASFSNSMKVAARRKPPLLRAASPCLDIKLPPITNRRERPFTPEQLQDVIDQLEVEHQIICALAVYWGMRWSELMGLHWSSISFETDDVQVREVWESDTASIRGYPKSRKPRYIPIVPDAMSLLQDWRALRPPTLARCGLPHTAWHGEGAGSKCTSALVFTPGGGQPMKLAAFSHQLKQAVRRAGLDHRSPHDLRHTFATWFRLGGGDLQMLQELLGHASLVPTVRYSHVASAHRDVLQRAFDKAEQDLTDKSRRQARLRTRNKLSILEGGAAGKFAQNLPKNDQRGLF